MATNFPAGLDTFPAVSASTPEDTSGSEHHVLHNNKADAIAAIESELGVNPSGSYATVVARLDAIGLGTGNANIAVTLPVSPIDGDFYLDQASPPPADTYIAQGNAGAAKTVNINDADVQMVVLNSATLVLTLTGDPSTNFVRRWELHAKHDATTSSRAITWPADVHWPGGVTPTLLATTNGAVAVFRFTTLTDGTHYGLHVGNFT